MAEYILSVKDLRTYFYLRSGIYKAVDGISFNLKKGETLGIVGESGSGKSVSMQSLLGLIPQPPGKIMSGTAVFDGMDLLNISEAQLRRIRGKRIAMIFQDPMTALNPYLRVSTQLMEVLLEHERISKIDARKRAVEILEKVGIPEARKRVDSYPHEFSGGMRQRVMIAMAIIAKPELLIADEPTTALDVTVQAQILDLLRDLRQEYHMSLILITHDLGVVAGVSDHVMVMYAGRSVEYGTANDVFYRAAHPYTKGLLGSVPKITGAAKDPLIAIPGLPPDPSRLPSGCAFAERCTSSMDSCRSDNAIPKRDHSFSHSSYCYQEGSVS